MTSAVTVVARLRPQLSEMITTPSHYHGAAPKIGVVKIKSKEDEKLMDSLVEVKFASGRTQQFRYEPYAFV